MFAPGGALAQYDETARLLSVRRMTSCRSSSVSVAAIGGCSCWSGRTTQARHRASLVNGLPMPGTVRDGCAGRRWVRRWAGSTADGRRRSLRRRGIIGCHDRRRFGVPPGTVNPQPGVGRAALSSSGVGVVDGGKVIGGYWPPTCWPSSAALMAELSHALPDDPPGAAWRADCRPSAPRCCRCRSG